MKNRLPVALTGAAALLLAGNSWADGSVVDCEVSAAVVYEHGDEIDGSALSIGYGTPGALASVEWLNEALGAVFETISADEIVCLQNGLLQAIFISDSGDGIFNGVPGYNFEIRMTDNRPAPSVIELNASITHRPTRRNEGVVNFDPPRPVTIPAEINVVTGGSGNGKVNLILDGVICKYRGVGASYEFDRCNSDNVAGDSVPVSEARLKIKQADRSFGGTSVSVPISSEPAPGARDTYFIAVIDALGNTVYEYSDPVDFGDIDITVLP